jgi:hypothetical protein
MQHVANAIGYKWTVQVKRKGQGNGLQLYYTPPEVGAKRLRSWERVKQYASQQQRKSARTAVEQQAASAKTAAMEDSPTSPVGKLMVKHLLKGIACKGALPHWPLVMALIKVTLVLHKIGQGDKQSAVESKIQLEDCRCCKKVLRTIPVPKLANFVPKTSVKW